MDSATLDKLPKWIEHNIYTFLGRDYDGKDSINDMRRDMGVMLVDEHIKMLNELLTDIKIETPLIKALHDKVYRDQLKRFRDSKLQLIEQSKLDTFKEQQIYYHKLDILKETYDEFVSDINERYKESILRIKNELEKTKKNIENGHNIKEFIKNHK